MISLTFSGTIDMHGKTYMTYDVMGCRDDVEQAGVAHALDVLMSATPMAAFGLDVFYTDDFALGGHVDTWGFDRLISSVELINLAL